MTTIDIIESRSQPTGLQRLFQAVAARLEASRLQRARRRALIHLSHYDAHMLRDMGLDPGDIEDALGSRSMSLLFYPIRPNDGR